MKRRTDIHELARHLYSMVWVCEYLVYCCLALCSRSDRQAILDGPQRDSPRGP